MKRGRWKKYIWVFAVLVLLVLLAACSPEEAREKGKQAGETFGNLLNGFIEGFCDSTSALILVVAAITVASIRRTFIDR
jgi:hypothetical protein